jgi:ribosome-associated protein
MIEYTPDEQEISKSQRKREAHALQELGARLIEFSEAQLATLPITDAVIDAIREYRNLPNSHGAKKRQLQYIGRVMRDCDFDAVQLAIDKLQFPHHFAAPKKQDKPQSKWAQRLMQDGDAAINELISIQPQLQRQKLRQLLRNIQNAPEDSRARHSAKIEDYIAQYDLD